MSFNDFKNDDPAGENKGFKINTSTVENDLKSEKDLGTTADTTIQENTSIKESILEKDSIFEIELKKDKDNETTLFLNEMGKNLKETGKEVTLSALQQGVENLKTKPEWIMRELSHKLGVKGVVTGQYTEKALDLEGSSALMSHYWLGESLNQHIAKLQNRHSSEKIIKHFQSMQTAFSEVMDLAANPEKYAKRFKETGELMIIPGNWTGHGVGVALMGNRLIFTNTGEGSTAETSGTHIFKIDDKNLITAEVIKKLCTAKSKDDFMAIIDTIKKASSEPIFIPSELQKRGSCSMSNPKKNMKGILACLIAQNEYGNLEDDSLLKAIKQTPTIHKSYKEFTNQTLRDDAAAKLIALANICQNNISEFESPLSDILIALAKEYILQHHDERDLQRAKFLYVNLPITMKLAVLKQIDPAIIQQIQNYEPKGETVQFGGQRDAEKKAQMESDKVTPQETPKDGSNKPPLA